MSPKSSQVVAATEPAIDEETGELVAALTGARVPFKIGKKYFIRAVTYHCVGRVARITGSFLELEEASWVAESGAFASAIAGKTPFAETQYSGDMGVNISAIVDYFPWPHELPRKR